MGKYIHLFQNQVEFENAYTGSTYIEPWVSYISGSTGVAYNKPPQPAPEYNYVNLGLPSGNLWATVDLGVADPNDRYSWGDYFA